MYGRELSQALEMDKDLVLVTDNDLPLRDKISKLTPRIVNRVSRLTSIAKRRTIP